MSRTRNPTLRKKVGVAVRTGIPVEYRRVDKLSSETHELIPELDLGLMQHNVKVFDDELKEHVLKKSWKEEIPRPDSNFGAVPKCSYAPIYSDPFKIIAGRTLMDLMGQKVPETIVWPGDGVRLSDKIPAYLLDRELAGKDIKNSFRFPDIPQVAQKMHLILEHTFWGRKLSELARLRPMEGADESSKRNSVERAKSVRHWAAVLVQRINHFLQGLGDPLWSAKNRKAIYEDVKPRNSVHRAKRFIELLRTVDGIFIQRYMAIPEERWTWHKYDLFTLKNISAMIGDEFFDGEIAVNYHNVVTRYSELKKLRKRFKDLSNRDQLDNFLSDKREQILATPRWLNDWIPVWRYTRSFKKPFCLAQVDGILSQTRAAGTPPDLVKMQSKRKFITTVSESPPPLTGSEKAIIRAALSTLEESIDQSVFTGLDTKARVTVTISSCWEKTQEEGGTIQAISEIVHLGAIGKTVPKRDLFSGAIVGEVSYTPEDTGTYIFWACLDEVLKSNPAEISMAALVMVAEPGKARTVTKSTAALKVVLDVVNKICSWPLTKIKSSASGMSKASHAWNSFKDTFTESGKEINFDPRGKPTVEVMPDGERVQTTTYRDVYLSSTDYEEATDAMNHEVASMISRYWMKKCGIPPILQMIVLRSCYKPRPIVFEARGPMAAYGEKYELPSPFANPNFIMLRQGVLMGDPLTKPVLHLVNILVRTVGEHFSSPDFQSKIFGYSGSIVSKEIRSMLQEEVGEEKLSPPPTGSAGTSSPDTGSPGPSMGPLAALLEQYPVDPTIIDPVMHLPEAIKTDMRPDEGKRIVVEIDPRLTWNWLDGRKEGKKTPPTVPKAPVQKSFNRNVSLRDPRIGEVIAAVEKQRQLSALLVQQRLQHQRVQEVFRTYEMIPRTTPRPTQGFREYRATATDNFRSASSAAIRQVNDEQTASCTKGLLKLFGILP
jgi:hypothetical protein